MPGVVLDSPGSQAVGLEPDGAGLEVSQPSPVLQVQWPAGPGSLLWGVPGGPPVPEGNVGDIPSPTVWTVTW